MKKKNKSYYNQLLKKNPSLLDGTTKKLNSSGEVKEVCINFLKDFRQKKRIDKYNLVGNNE